MRSSFASAWPMANDSRICSKPGRSRSGTRNCWSADQACTLATMYMGKHASAAVAEQIRSVGTESQASPSRTDDRYIEIAFSPATHELAPTYSEQVPLPTSKVAARRSPAMGQTTNRTPPRALADWSLPSSSQGFTRNGSPEDFQAAVEAGGTPAPQAIPLSLEPQVGAVDSDRHSHLQ